MISLDYRERAISQVLGVEHRLMALPVGDICCRYDDGSAWVAERKLAIDLARSVIYLFVLVLFCVLFLCVVLSGCSLCTEVIDGRWSDQLHRLHANLRIHNASAHQSAYSSSSLSLTGSSS